MSTERSRLASREDAVLLVIDAQERLLPHIHARESLVGNIVRLVRFAGILGIPVLCTEQENLGETAAQIRAVLDPRERIRKLEFGCFGCGQFRDELGSLGRRTLFLTGIEAHICVAQTALGALPTYRVQVVADAVSSRAPENKRIALERLRQAGAVVTSLEMSMFELMGRAGTEEFRAVLPLVK